MDEDLRFAPGAFFPVGIPGIAGRRLSGSPVKLSAQPRPRFWEAA